MLVVGCSHGKHIARKVAKLLNKPYTELRVIRFPDGEINLRFLRDLKNQDVVLVQSFYGPISDLIMEALFAAYTARDLGAKKISLMAPYFPYFRQDKRFHPGECISIQIIAKLIDAAFDNIAVIDPHLHRETKLKHIFKIPSKKLTANPVIAEYIKKHVKNPLIIGPDEESYKWARHTAEMIGCSSVILKKKRFSGRKVKVTLDRKIDIRDKDIVIVDDIISTGHTLLETIRHLKKLGAKKITCIGVHGLFVEKALEKLRKADADIICTNTIPSRAAKIDISRVVKDALAG